MQASNFNALPQVIKVEINSKDGVEYEDSASLYHVSGNQPDAENSFDNPKQVTVAHYSEFTAPWHSTCIWVLLNSL